MCLSRKYGITKLAVIGGQLNSKVDAKLVDKGGHELQMLALMNTGHILFWKESIPQFMK